MISVPNGCSCRLVKQKLPLFKRLIKVMKLKPPRRSADTKNLKCMVCWTKRQQVSKEKMKVLMVLLRIAQWL